VEVSSSRIDSGERAILHSIIHDTTDRKRAEEAAHRSETKFRALYNSSSDAVMLLDEKGFFDCNPAALAMFGCASPKEFCAKHPADLSPSKQPCGTDSMALASQRIATAQEAGSQRFEWLHQRADTGMVFPCEVLLSAMELDGKPVLQAVLRDITERKRDEEKIRQLSRAVEQSPVSIVITDTQGAIEYANATFSRVTGYTLDEVRGKNPRVLKGGTTSREVYRQLWQTISQGREWHGELHNRKKTGELYWEFASISPLLDTQGRITHFLAVKEDITERKRAEDALAAGEARMRAITDSAQDAILMMDPEGRVSYWNPAAERIFGYAHDEAIGKNLHQIIVPQHYHEAHHAALPVFLKTGQGAVMGKTLDLQALRKDGKEISVQLSLSAVQLDGAWHAVGLLRDITDRKRVEEALLETNQHLEEATARANEMAVQAEMASAAKSEFLANMSHEIRTPMNGVLGMIGLLLDTDMTGDQRRYAQTVRASGETLLALINDILDFSKIEARKLDLETLDFDLHNLLDDFAGIMAMRAHEKGLVLGCVVAPEAPPDLRGDPGRLRQILINLTANAIKFTSQGEVIIRTTLVTETPTEVQLRFAVRDNGIGIPSDKLGRLFTKFSQVDSSTTRTYGGTGLGLAISKQLAEMMGGEIGVESQPGQGSEFWFTVRLGKQLSQAPAAATVHTDLRGVRVLVVDDHPVNREILLVLSKSWGLRPAQAVDGPSALQALVQAKAQNDPFAIAVLDMQMPGMDGISLGRAIKADPNLEATRLVMCTSLGQMSSDQRWEEAGFVGSLTKPVRRQELHAALQSAFSGKKTVASQATSTPVFAPGPGKSPARILVAEDNITNQQVAVGILRKLGLRAEVAANGAEAVKALETIPYDLVLMDVQMPELDGLEATRRIRDLQSRVLNHQVPIIAMTAHAMRSDRERCLQAGMDDYLTKPIQVPALAALLEKWLKPEGKDGQSLEEDEAKKKGNHSPLRAGIPVFDRAGLMARVMDDEELAQVVMDGFLEELPGQIQQLKHQVATGETGQVEQLAHKIKGAAATVGADALCLVASAMEQAGKAGDLALISARMPELEAQFNALKEALKTNVSPPSTSTR
jgi:two-component system sensor histidine kinase/response regulator